MSDTTPPPFRPLPSDPGASSPGPTWPSPPTGGTAPPPPPPGNLTPPPGYVAYGGGTYGGFSPFERIRGLAKWIKALLVVNAIVTLINVLVTRSLANDAQAFLDGTIDNDEFVKRYAPALLVTLLSSVTSIALVVLTLIWNYRVAQNHRKLGRQGGLAPGWAIGGWFAPPLVLYILPFVMLRQLWKGSDASYAPGDPGWKQAKVSPLVTIWWILYGLVPTVMIGVSLNSTFSGFGGSGDMENVAKQINDQATPQLISGVASVGAAIAFFLLVTQLTARQTELTRES